MLLLRATVPRSSPVGGGNVPQNHIKRRHVQILQIRRKQLMMNYWVNLQGHSEDRHPTVKVLLPCWEKERSKRKCFAWNSDKEAREMILSQKRYIPTVP